MHEFIYKFNILFLEYIEVPDVLLSIKRANLNVYDVGEVVLGLLKYRMILIRLRATEHKTSILNCKGFVLNIIFFIEKAGWSSNL